MAEPVRVALELGRTWVFSSALDWPGWCRRGRGEQAALEVLRDYAERYAPVAGADFEPGPLRVVGRVDGSATTDFGAPGARGPWDEEPLARTEAERQAGLLAACWTAFDRIVVGAPPVLAAGAPDAVWPARYAIRRTAWHVLDHAWEIQTAARGRPSSWRGDRA